MEPPPSYEAATGSSSSSGPSNRPVTRNGIPPNVRRSMEDERRPTPEGWVRQYDHNYSHQFFVDTKASPPRSIWHHPYDDEQYLASLSADEREQISRLKKTPTNADIEAESTDEDEVRPKKSHDAHTSTSSNSTQQNSRAGFGRKMKDRLTGTTHEQREKIRKQRADEEHQAYVAHQRLRAAMSRACETGQPQYLGRDPNTNKDIVVGPPEGMVSSYPQSPHQPDPRRDPNVMYVAPGGPYQRPYRGGYGGGMGLPIAGGLLGGALLGSLLLPGF